MKNSQKRDRITARVPKHVKDDIQTAADLMGIKLNDFIVQATLAKAHEVIEHNSVIRLSQAQAEAFFEALENPSEPNAKLKVALARAKEIGLA